MTRAKGWRPLQRATLARDYNEDDIAAAIKLTGVDRAQAIADLEAELDATEYWINDLYQVALHRFNTTPPMIHLNIRRRDGKVIFRDWRHFQWIKNQLVGEECEGVEIYPAESRLSDSSNKYHLFCFADPTYRIPFGLQGRLVLDDSGVKQPGLRQRRLPKMN